MNTLISNRVTLAGIGAKCRALLFYEDANE